MAVSLDVGVVCFGPRRWVGRADRGKGGRCKG